MDINYYLLIILFLPLLAAMLPLWIRHENARDGGVIAIAFVVFMCVMKVLSHVMHHGDALHFTIAEPIKNVPVVLFLEPLGMVFAFVVSFLWIVSIIYSIGYMRGNEEHHRGRFSSFFSIAIFGAFGVAFAGNLFTMFLFYEVLTLCTYPLVTHHGGDADRRGGRVYLGVLMATSLLFFLPAIVATWYLTGNMTFVEGGILEGKASPALVAVLLLLYCFGVGKAALMPFHRWLPAAMVAPTPVSALLHAVAVVKAGVFCIVKIIVYIFGIDFLNGLVQQNWLYGGWLVYIAGFTVVAASIIALTQDNLKRRLAYSTVSQLSYVIMAAAILVPKATVAAVFHIVAHAFGKITLFFAAGSIYTASKKKNVSELSGIGKRMPWTMTAFAVAALSMIGVPPLAGFISKWSMLVGAFTQELYVVVAVLIISTVLNAFYLLPIVYKAFFEDEVKDDVVAIKQHGEAPYLAVLALLITALASVVIFIFPDVFLALAEEIVDG